MNHLFNVPVRGEGTCEVEAFWSYVSRLAEIHEVSVHKLLDYSYGCYRRSRFVSSNYDDIAYRWGVRLGALVRPNRTTDRAVRAIEHVTRKSTLRATTFLSLGVLARYPTGFSARAKWCPSCMLEFEEQGDSGYFKLLWSFNDMTHCQNHNVALVDKCEACGGCQDNYRIRCECVYCQECGASLGRQYQSNPSIDSWSFQCYDLVGLVETIAKDPDLWFPDYGFRKSIARIYDYYQDEDHPVREGIRSISYGNPSKMISGRMRITLLTVRRLAAIAGVDLVDLLKGADFEIPLDLNHEWELAMPSQILIQERKRVDKKSKVLAYIEDYLKNQLRLGLGPPPLSRAAVAAQVSVGYLQYNFKALANSITMAHALWKKKRAEYNRLWARSEAEIFFKGENSPSVNRSKKMALKLIIEKTKLPKNLVREEINYVYEKLKAEDCLRYQRDTKQKN